MSIATLRDYLQDVTMFNSAYFAVEADYTISGGETTTIPVIFSFDGGDTSFEMSLEKQKKRGTVDIKKEDIANVKRHDTITYNNETYLVLGLQTENTLNVIANIEQTEHKSAGGLKRE